MMAMGLFVYVATRSAMLAITWDEAFTCLEFVMTGKVYPGAGGGMAANNHFLNTWSVYLLVQLFGTSEFVLRVPSMIGCGLFLIYVARFALRIKPGWAAIPVFFLFTCNPYLLDFFSLSRGYGLSFALLTASVFHAICFSATGKNRQLRIAMLYAMAGVAANMVLLHFLLALVLLPLYLLWVNTGRRFSLAGAVRVAWSDQPVWLRAVLVAFISCFAVYGIVLQQHGALFYGGQTGFWHDTVGTVVDRTGYEKSYAAAWSPFTCLFIVLVVAASGIRLVTRGGQDSGDFRAVTFLLFCCILFMLLQRFLFGSLYLIDRSALYLYVLFCFILVTLAGSFQERHKLYMAIPAICGVLMMVHFAHTVNWRYVLEWKRDADVPAIITDIDRLRNDVLPAGRKVRIGASLEFEQPFNYYIATDSIGWLQPLDREDRLRPGMDFYVLDPRDRASMDPSMEALRRYKVSGAVLLQP